MSKWKFMKNISTILYVIHYEIILTILFTHNKFNFMYDKIGDALSSSTISKVILLVRFIVVQWQQCKNGKEASD